MVSRPVGRPSRGKHERPANSAAVIVRSSFDVEGRERCRPCSFFPEYAEIVIAVKFPPLSSFGRQQPAILFCFVSALCLGLSMPGWLSLAVPRTV